MSTGNEYIVAYHVITCVQIHASNTKLCCNVHTLRTYIYWMAFLNYIMAVTMECDNGM